MHMIGGDRVIQHAQTKPLLGFENPTQIPAPIAYISALDSRIESVERLERSAAIERLELPVPLMTDYAKHNQAGNGGWLAASFSLKVAFRPKNWPSKRPNDAFYAMVVLLNQEVV